MNSGKTIAFYWQELLVCFLPKTNKKTPTKVNALTWVFYPPPLAYVPHPTHTYHEQTHNILSEV